MVGKSCEKVRVELQASGMSEDQIKKILPHKVGDIAVRYPWYHDMTVKTGRKPW